MEPGILVGTAPRRDPSQGDPLDPLRQAVHSDPAAKRVLSQVVRLSGADLLVFTEKLAEFVLLVRRQKAEEVFQRDFVVGHRHCLILSETSGSE